MLSLGHGKCCFNLFFEQQECDAVVPLSLSLCLSLCFSCLVLTSLFLALSCALADAGARRADRVRTVDGSLVCLTVARAFVVGALAGQPAAKNARRVSLPSLLVLFFLFISLLRDLAQRPQMAGECTYILYINRKKGS